MADQKMTFAEIKELAARIGDGKAPDNLKEHLNKFSTEELNLLFREVDIYTQSIKQTDADKDAVTYNTNGYVVVSITNELENAMEDRKMLSLVGFLYHSLLEYDDLYWEGKAKPAEGTPEREEADEVVKIRKLIIKEHIDKLFAFNPELHLRSSTWPYPADLSRHVLPNKPKMARYAKRVVKLDMQTPPTTIEAITHDDATADQTLGRGVRGERLAPPDPANVPLGDVYIPVPSYDIFESWAAYERNNFTALEDLANDIYGSKTDIKFAMRVFKTFPGSKEGLEAANVYRNDRARELGISLDVIDNDAWVMMQNTDKTTLRIKYDTDVAMRSILDQRAADMTHAAELIKRRTTRKKKAAAVAMASALKSTKKSPLDVVEPRTKESLLRAKKKVLIAEPDNDEYKPPTIKDYRAFSEATSKSLLADDDREMDELDELIERGVDPRTLFEDVDEDGIPLDSIAVRCLINKDGALREKHMFVKAEKRFRVDGNSGE